MTDNRFKDPRLLEAFDHIDLRYIAEVADNLEFDPAPTVHKKTPWYSLKYVAALAACVLLLGAVIPVVQYVSQNPGMFFPGGLFGDTDEASTAESDLPEEVVENGFRLTYEISKRVCMRGDIVYVTASVENISGRDLTYTAVIDSYYPSVELYSQLEDGEVKAAIRHEEIDTYSGFDEFTAKAGQIGKKTYTFIIPKDAQLGSYALTLRYRENRHTYKDVLMIIDKTSQNENNEYEYSPVEVSAGGATINPIRTLASSLVWVNDNDSHSSDDLGIWHYFGQDSTNPATFPLLIYDSDFAIDNVKTKISDYGVYNFDYERINEEGEFKDILNLPAGEYLIVLEVHYLTKGVNTNPHEYDLYVYQDFFVLVVPDDSNTEASPEETTAEDITAEDSSGVDTDSQDTTEFKKLYLQFTPELEPISEEQIKKVHYAGFEYFFKVTPEEYLATYGEENREKVERISSDMGIKYKDAYGPYYGTFGESIVYATISSGFQGGRIVNLAGYSWGYHQAAHVLVYNNGKVYTIEDAYEKGYLTDKDIATIAERHEKFEEYIGGDYNFVPET